MYIGNFPANQTTGARPRDEFIGDGTQTTFSLTQGVPGSFETNALVVVENVVQQPIESYTIIDSYTLSLTSISGSFALNNTVTGGTSGATGKVIKVNAGSIVIERLSGTFTTESVSNGTATATITAVNQNYGGALKFSEAPASGTVIYVVHQGQATYNMIPAAGSVGATQLDPNIRNFTVDNFTGNGSTTAFSLTETPQTANSILVIVDGIVQSSPSNYTLSGNTLTLTSAPDTDADIRIIHLGFSAGIKSVPDGAITTSKIADGAITSSKIADGTVIAADVLDGTLTPAKLTTGHPTWDASGNLGVGTDSPESRVHASKTYVTPVNGISANTVGIFSNNNIANGVANLSILSRSSGYQRLYFGTQGTENANFIEAYANGGAGYLAFATGIGANAGTERMRIDSNGNLNIGTSGKANRLYVSSPYDTNAGGTTAKFSTDSGNTASLDVMTYGSTYSAGSNFGLGANSINLLAPAGFALASGSTSPLVFGTGTTERMRLDSSGNLGLGVTPSAWISTGRAIQLGLGAAIAGRSDNRVVSVLSNAYLNASANWTYSTTGNATNFETYNGNFYWLTAPSGTAGNAISFTQAMTLNASGNLLVGATSGNQRLVLKGGDTNTSIYLENGSTSVGYFGVAKGYNSSFSATDILIGGYSNNTIFANSNTERMRIDSSGNVGIGTSSPAARLQLQSATATTRVRVVSELSSSLFYSGLEFVRSGLTGGALIQSARDVTYGGVGVAFLTTADNAAEISGTYTERMRIDSSGGLRIGTTSQLEYGASTERLTVDCVGGNAAVFRATGNTYPTIVVRQDYGSGTQTYLYFKYNGTVTGNIQSNGSSTAYGTSSDYRLKENIQPMQNALDVVAQLNPVTYTWKADGSDGQGFIAHELQAIVPDCVTGEKDAVDETGNPVYQGVDTSFLVATLTKAIQEQQAIINALEARLAVLESK